jgi:multidrug efflux pump subunit AcrA (membrane-fusion protein)
MALNKKTYFIVGSVLAIALLVVALIIWNQRNKIETVSPKYGPIVESIYGLGKVKTDNVYEVKLGVVKTMERLYVREGAVVKKNDRLVKFEGGLLFRAPFAGTVTNIAFRENQYVFPQQTVIRVEDLTTKYIEVSLEQQGAMRVQPGQPVRVVFESIRGEILNGKVSAIFSRNEEFLAHINVPLASNVLPGMTADVAIEIGRKEKALLIPLSGVTDGRVKIIRDGKRKTIKLKIGGVDGNWAEVLEGDIKVSDQVIIKRVEETE